MIKSYKKLQKIYPSYYNLLKGQDLWQAHDQILSIVYTLNSFEWIENTSQFNKDFIKNYNEEMGEGNFIEVGVQYI